MVVASRGVLTNPYLQPAVSEGYEAYEGYRFMG